MASASEAGGYAHAGTKIEHIARSGYRAHGVNAHDCTTAFVDFKNWMAKKALDWPAIKRRRDVHQAAIVQTLLDENLLIE